MLLSTLLLAVDEWCHRWNLLNISRYICNWHRYLSNQCQTNIILFSVLWYCISMCSVTEIYYLVVCRRQKLPSFVFVFYSIELPLCLMWLELVKSIANLCHSPLSDWMARKLCFYVSMFRSVIVRRHLKV